MTLKNILSVILITVILSTALTACFGSHEIDDWAYVNSIGIDTGVSDVMRFTFQLTALKSSSGPSGGGGGSTSAANDTTVLSIEAPTFYAGINMTNTSISRTLNFMHAKFLVISEDMARKGIERFMNGMVRTPQIRRIMHVIIVRGTAKDFLEKFKPFLGSSISRTQELMMDQENVTGLFDDVNYNQFYEGLKSASVQPAAVLAGVNDFSAIHKQNPSGSDSKHARNDYPGEMPREGGNPYEFIGTAVFDGDKMVGELGGEETRMMLMARGEFKSGSITIADPMEVNRNLTCYTHQQKKTKVKITFQNGIPQIRLNLFLEAELTNLQSSTEYENPKIKPILENALRTYIKNGIDKTIEKCKALNSDVFNFGEKAARHFSTIPQWEKYNWKSHFKNAKVEAEVSLIIRRTGTLMKTSPVISSEGIKK